MDSASSWLLYTLLAFKLQRPMNHPEESIQHSRTRRKFEIKNVYNLFILYKKNTKLEYLHAMNCKLSKFVFRVGKAMYNLHVVTSWYEITFSSLTAGKRCLFSCTKFCQDPTEPSNTLPHDRQIDRQIERKFGISVGRHFLFLTNTYQKHRFAFFKDSDRTFPLAANTQTSVFVWSSVCSIKEPFSRFLCPLVSP
jgi:hypothetical protein